LPRMSIRAERSGRHSPQSLCMFQHAQTRSMMFDATPITSDEQPSACRLSPADRHARDIADIASARRRRRSCQRQRC
jgi:hypothetical protein